jgi:hypothetical protein
MAQRVTRYRSTDGELWIDEADADARDLLIAAVDRIMGRLEPASDRPGSPFNLGRSFVQQDPDTVREVKAELIRLSEEPLGWWFESRKEKGVDPSDIDVKDIVQMIEGHDPPLLRAWGRLWSIDAESREWENPDIANNPEPPKLRVVKG